MGSHPPANLQVKLTTALHCMLATGADPLTAALHTPVVSHSRPTDVLHQNICGVTPQSGHVYSVLAVARPPDTTVITPLASSLFGTAIALAAHQTLTDITLTPTTGLSLNIGCVAVQPLQWPVRRDHG